MIRYWNRIVSMEIDRLPRIVVECIFDKHIGWCKEVFDILEEIGMAEQYVNKEKCNLDVCKEKLNGIVAEDFISSIHQKSKLRTYKLFKQNYECERYVINYMSKSEISLLCQLRLGILLLEVEVGRFGLKNNDGQLMRIPLEERICKLCNMKRVEDEVHFICECPIYERER